MSDTRQQTQFDPTVRVMLGLIVMKYRETEAAIRTSTGKDWVMHREREKQRDRLNLIYAEDTKLFNSGKGGSKYILESDRKIMADFGEFILNEYHKAMGTPEDKRPTKANFSTVG